MDEPTTALDVTVEAAVLDLIAELRRELDTAILYISHNLGVIARVSDRVGVMYAGEMVEEADVAALFLAPRHPYTRGLLRCVPARRRRPGGAAAGRDPRARALADGAAARAACSSRGATSRPRVPDERRRGWRRSRRATRALRPVARHRGYVEPAGRAGPGGRHGRGRGRRRF